MMFRNFFASLTACLLLAGGMAMAQGVGASGDIKGTVVDPTGAVMANATVTASNAEKGIKRTAQSDPTGQYVLSGLSPAIYEVSANISGFDTEIHVRQTPQTGLSFYGSNGRGNNVTVDGGQFNGDSGAVEVNLSQDAVQEFQINRSSYTAELGAASGASINIVSKSGTNDLHGSIYGFFRNDAMDARNPFAFTNALNPGDPFSLTATSVPTQNTLTRQQYGATLGFPIKKDKTF